MGYKNLAMLLGRIVPASMFRYISILTVVTLKPRDLRRKAREAEVMPLPRPLTTPPEIKIYFNLRYTIFLTEKCVKRKIWCA